MEYNSPWIINKIIGKKNLQKIDGQNWMPIWIIQKRLFTYQKNIIELVEMCQSYVKNN